MLTRQDLENYKWDTSNYVQISITGNRDSRFKNHKWDTSTWVSLDTKVLRDAETGRLVLTKVRQPKVKKIIMPNGKKGFILTEDYVYQWTVKTGIKRKITLLKGFMFDGASIPWVFRLAFNVSKGGELLAASSVHDKICNGSGWLPEGSYMVVCDGIWIDCSKDRWSWNEAAKLFCRIMRETGIPMWKRRAFYRAVRAYGLFAGWKM